MNSPHSKTSVFTDLLRIKYSVILLLFRSCARFSEQYEHPVLYELGWVLKDKCLLQDISKAPIMSFELCLFKKLLLSD